MKTVAAVVGHFGGPTRMGAAIDVRANVISQWSRRNSVPGEHWQAIVDAARELRIAGVTLAVLAAMHARKDERKAA